MVLVALGQLVYGTLSDRIGRRPILLFGALLFSLGGVGAAWVDDIESLTLFRALQGLGAAACLSMARTIVNDCFERSEAARNMSAIQMIQAVVPVMSLAFGGLLVELAGWQSTMVVIAIAGFLVFLFSLYLLEETNLSRATVIDFLSVLAAYRAVLGNRFFILFALTSGMLVGSFFSMNGFIPYQYQRMGYSAAEFGLWFSLAPVCFILGNTINRQYLVEWGIEKAAMAGCLLTLVSVIAMYTTQAIGMQHALSLALPCALFGFSNGIVLANVTVGAISAAGRHAGTGSGLAGAWQMAFSGVAGAVIIGLGGADDFLLAAGCLVVMSLVAVFSMAYVFRRRAELA